MQDDPDSDSWGGQNVFHVYTKSEGTALDGTKFRECGDRRNVTLVLPVAAWPRFLGKARPIRALPCRCAGWR